MKIFDNKGRVITLNQDNFLAEGGEGKLYVDKQNVFKIYIDKHKVISVGKLEELQHLDRSNIIRPTGSVFNDQQQRIGFMMSRVNDPVPLARLFTSSYWQANGITTEKVFTLIKSMQETIQYIHKSGFLQIDGNEFNYLTDAKSSKAYFIDVDSFQTPGYSATAIMPSIRDYTQQTFNTKSDWFSFAIIAFQLFTGIHPFKGRSKSGLKKDFETRILAGISVLNSDIKYPSSVRDFSTIPKEWMNWFEALFERGERIEPPTGNIQIVSMINRREIKNGDKVQIKEIGMFDSLIKRFNTINGQRVIRAGNELFIGSSHYDIPEKVKAMVLNNKTEPLFLKICNDLLTVLNDSGEIVNETLIKAKKIFVEKNIPYVLNGSDLMEIQIITMGDKLIVAPGMVRKVLPHATEVFDGLVVQNILGKTHLLIPVASGIMPIMAINELDPYTIVEAKYEQGVAVMNLADKKGNYTQARVRFSHNYLNYDIEFRSDVDQTINFTVLDKGIVVYLSSDNLIEITSSEPFSDAVKLVEDPQIHSYMRLANDAGRVAFTVDERLFTMSLHST